MVATTTRAPMDISMPRVLRLERTGSTTVTMAAPMMLSTAGSPKTQLRPDTIATADDTIEKAGDTTEVSMSEALEAQWARRKAQFLAHFRGVADTDVLDDSVHRMSEGAAIASAPSDSKCHVCNASLHLLRLRHYCRNCKRAVCGVHSKNQVPLPHLGMLKEVRVCDICTRQLVQRRAGYRSPKGKKRSNSRFSRKESSGETEEEILSPLPLSPVPGLDIVCTPTAMGSSSIEAELFSPMCGVIYSCLLEEQDNTMDDLLYLGTFTMGGRAMASRNLNSNVAIWKDRMFMLTSTEMLCFKASTHDDDASLGEVRSSVHLTDILHIEVSDQHPRILSVIRSDGRIFRIRAKTPEQCKEVEAALRKAIQSFQDAVYKLQRGPQPEDNCISCVTIQHESSLPEIVVVSAPAVGESFQVDMYPSSILRLYVNGPNANGTAMYSREMLIGAEARNPVLVEAEPLEWGLSEQVLHVSLQSQKMLPTASSETNNRKFWLLISVLVANAAVMDALDVTFLELLAWLSALVLFLTRYHDQISLLFTTKRFHRPARLEVTCVEIVMGKSEEVESSSDELISDDELDNRFLEGCNGDVEEAKKRYLDTMRWRKENDIDHILLRPSPYFATMKSVLLHFHHKKDKLGHPVAYESLGTLKKSMEAFLEAGVTEEDATMHHIRMQEFLWTVVDPRPFPQGTQLKVYDMKGISMSDVGGHVFNYTKKLGETVATYNPERVYQIFLLNPPTWFNLIWKLVSPLVNPKTRERVHVLRGQKEITKTLLEFIDIENLPAEYGGKCVCEGGCSINSPEEIDLRELTEFVNANYKGDPEDPVIKEYFDKLCAKYRAELPPNDSKIFTVETS